MDEGISLIKRFDGEFPEQYIKDCCEYMGISLQDYHDTTEKLRSPHLWEKVNGIWEGLRLIIIKTKTGTTFNLNLWTILLTVKGSMWIQF